MVSDLCRGSSQELRLLQVALPVCFICKSFGARPTQQATSFASTTCVWRLYPNRQLQRRQFANQIPEQVHTACLLPPNRCLIQSETSGQQQQQQQQQQPYATSSIGHGQIHGPPGPFPNYVPDRRPLHATEELQSLACRGFTFSNQGDPLLNNPHILKFLQKPSFMPHHKSRGDVDSYLRFETNLRMLFEVVIFFQDFLGQRGFWHKIRSLLRLPTVTPDTLQDTIKLYCQGRRDYLRKSYKPFDENVKPSSRIAELADIVIGLREGEHTHISQFDWDRQVFRWRPKLGQILTEQGVHTYQYNNGTCAKELLEPTSPNFTNFIPTNISPRAETQKRVRFDLRKPSSPTWRPPLEEPRGPRDNEAPPAQAAKIALPPKPPAPLSPSNQPLPPPRATEQAHASRQDTTKNSSCEKLPDSIPAKPPNPIQSLDELVSAYKGGPSPAENSRKRSRDELPDETDTANKRLATGPTNESPRIARTTLLAPIVTGLGTPCEDIDSGVAVTSPQTLTPQQANEKAADLQEDEDVPMDITEVVESREKPIVESEAPADQLVHDDTSETAMARTPDRTISPRAESESLFVEKAEFQEEEAGPSQSVTAIQELLFSLEKRQTQLEKLEVSVDSQKEQLEQWALDRKRLAELETQMRDRANDTSRIRSLQKVTEAHGDILKHQSSNSRRLEDKLVGKLTETMKAMDTHTTDEGLARAATNKLTQTLQAELRTKYTADEEYFRITHGRIDEVRKQLMDEKANSGNRHRSMSKRCDDIQQEIRDAKKHLQNQLEQHSDDCKVQRAEADKSAGETALKTQIAELQKKFGQRAKTDEATETRLADLQRQLTRTENATETRLSDLEKQLTERAKADKSAEETAIKAQVAELQKQLDERARGDKFTKAQVAELQGRLGQCVKADETTEIRLAELQRQLGQRTQIDETTETRLADLQRQLSQVQEALRAREATTPQVLQPPPPPPPATSLSNCLDPVSLPRLDDGTFLDTMYFEMAKLRTAMRTRIRAMDARGVPDEDDAKLAVSDISFELGRVLDLARKRINKL